MTGFLKKGILGALAPAFNFLLDIEPGHFGATPRSVLPGAGMIRARARETEQRRRQEERLKNAEPAKVSRQQRRSFAIRGR